MSEKVIKKCLNMGIYPKNQEILDGLIIIKTEDDENAVIFDQDYHIINITTYHNLLNQIDMLCRDYTKQLDLPYPFNNYSLKDFYTISSIKDTELIKLFNNNHNYVKIFHDYIKLLTENIEQYYNYYYHMLKLGINVPSATDYLKSLINKVNEIVLTYIKLGEIPIWSNIFNLFGINGYNNFSNIDTPIFKLLLLSLGYIVDANNKISPNSYILDLKAISQTILQANNYAKTIK